MPTKTQGYQTGEFLLSDQGDLSRDQEVVTISGGVGLASGTVLGRITASGKLIKYVDSANDGSQAAVGVLLTDLSAAANGDHKVVVIKRLAEVIGSVLNAGAGVDANGKADLLALNIVVR